MVKESVYLIVKERKRRKDTQDQEQMNAKIAELELTEPILHDELVERCKRGDSRGFAELYHKYSKAIYNTSLRIVNHTGDAEDVLQQAFSHPFTPLHHSHYNSTFLPSLQK